MDGRVGEAFVDIARLFASSSFLFVYSGLLVLLTVVGIVRNHLSIIAEAKVSREIAKVVDAAQSLDASGKVAQLLLLNESTGARILTHDACRADDLGEHKVWRNPASATARATASYLGVMAAVPAARHSLEGASGPQGGMLEKTSTAGCTRAWAGFPISSSVWRCSAPSWA